MCACVCDVHHICSSDCASGNVQGRENPNPLLASAPAAFFSLTGPWGSTTRRTSWLRCRLQPRHQEVPAVCRFSNRLHTVCAAAAKRTEPRVTHLAAAIAENLLVAQPEGARWPLSPCHNIRKNVLPYCETVACQHRIGPPFEAHTLPGSARKENLLSLQKRLWCEMQGPKRHAQVTLLPCVCVPPQVKFMPAEELLHAATKGQSTTHGRDGRKKTGSAPVENPCLFVSQRRKKRSKRGAASFVAAFPVGQMSFHGHYAVAYDSSPGPVAWQRKPELLRKETGQYPQAISRFQGGRKHAGIRKM